MTGDALSLADVLAPRSVAEFLEEWKGRRFLLIEGERGKLASLFSWEDLNHIIRVSSRDAARVRLFREGNEVRREAFVARRGPHPHTESLSVAGMMEQLRSGATLIVDGVEESSESLRELAADLEWRLHERAFVNVYAAWTTSHGFGTHWDDQDVFILQVAGRKQWKIYPDNRPYPIKKDPARHSAPEAPVWSGTLNAGDVLYIPRGWWHDAVPVEGPCLHLTVGLQTRTGLDYLEWLKSRLMMSELFRQDLPRFAGPEVRRDHFARLRSELLSAWGPAIDEEYFRSLDAARDLRTEPSFPWSAMQDPLPDKDDLVVRLNVRRPVEMEERSENGRKGVYLTAGGRTRRFPPAARGLVEALLRGNPLTLAALCAEVQGTISRGQVRLLLTKLHIDGDVSVSGPSPSAPSDECSDE